MGILASIESLYSISGFGLGFLIGMTEMGGGSLKTPLLILLFGIQPATAVGTDLLAIGMSRGTGHWRIAPRPVSAVILHKTECWPALQSQSLPMVKGGPNRSSGSAGRAFLPVFF